MPSRATLVKIGIAAGAVLGGAFAGASIAAPVVSLAQEDDTADAAQSAVDDAADALTDTAEDLTGGVTDVQQAPVPAPGTTEGRVEPAQAPGDDERPPRGPGHMCSGEAPAEEDAERVRAAVADEIEGATVERIHTECENGAAYAAHFVRSDGTRGIAFLNEDFEVTDVKECGSGRGFGRGPGRPDDAAPTIESDSDA